MRNSITCMLTAFVLVSITTQGTLHAQEVSPSFKIGGGLGIPLDAEGINNGMAILAGASLPVYGNLHAVVEGRYSKFGAKEELVVPGVDADVKLTGGNFGIMLRSPTNTVSVYGQGGIGLTRAEGKVSGSFLGESVSVSHTETVLSFTFGGGIHIPINPSIAVAIDARYNHAMTEDEATKWMPFSVNLVFNP